MAYLLFLKNVQDFELGLTLSFIDVKNNNKQILNGYIRNSLNTQIIIS